MKNVNPPEQHDLSLAKAEPIPPPVLSSQALTPELAFQLVLEGKLDMAKMDVAERVIRLSAEKRFDDAFAKMQAKLPTIFAKTTIPNRGKYEKFEDIMATIKPILSEFGFSISFENDFKENKIGETCCLSHGGHTKRHTYWTRPGGKSDSETQSDSKAATTARRNALIRAINLVIRQDVLIDEENDPRNAGSVITPEQADEIERRVKLLNLPLKDWLELGGCDNFKNMLSSAYEVVDRALSMRERRSR